MNPELAKRRQSALRRPVRSLTRRITVPGVAEAGLIAETATQAGYLGYAVNEGNTTQTIVFSALTAISTGATIVVDRLRRKHNRVTNT
jgi:hypothetical protein